MDSETEYVEKLSEKMKRLENEANYKLECKKPVIMRLDGRAFNKFTKGLDKPFDQDLSGVFQYVVTEMKTMMDNIKFVYSQSDEISVLLTDWDNENTDEWFSYRIQKMASVSASMITALFNKRVEYVATKYLAKIEDIDEAMFKKVEDFTPVEKKYFLWKGKRYKANFDCRVFNLEKEDVAPYFIYRQKDAMRNSVLALAQQYYSQKQLEGKCSSDMKTMIFEKSGIDYDSLPMLQKAGFTAYRDEKTNKWNLDLDIPEFMTNRDYINKYL